MPKAENINELFLPVILCDECRTDVGGHKPVPIEYRGTGGWSPRWEGYVCEHVAKIPGDEFLKRLELHYGTKPEQHVTASTLPPPEVKS